MTITNWEPLFHAINDWMHSIERFGKDAETEEVYHLKRKIGKRMLCDVASISDDHPGILHRISVCLRGFNDEIPLRLNPDYELLFADHKFEEDGHISNERQNELIRSTAQQWYADGPIHSVTRFERLIDAYTVAGSKGPRQDHQLFHEIAKLTNHPEEWLAVIMPSKCSADMAPLFFWRLNELRPMGWEALFRSGFEIESLRGNLINIALTMPSMPTDIVHQASAYPDVAAWILQRPWFHHGLISDDTLYHLLNHPDSRVAVAAAIAEWHTAPEGEVRASVTAEWRSAILHSSGNEIGFCEILTGDRSLLLDWILGRLREKAKVPDQEVWHLHHALQLLDQEARIRVIDVLPDEYQYKDLARDMIGNDPILYRHFLAKSHSRDFHLRPLLGKPNTDWIAMATEALAAGYGPDNIALASLSFAFPEGDESSYWEGWQSAFEPLLVHIDERIRQIGRIGLDMATRQRDRVVEEKRLFDVYGAG